MFSDSENTTAAFPAGSGALIATCLRKIGQPDFYEAAVEMIRSIVPCDFWIVARYEFSARPVIVSETGMAPEARLEYSDALWQLDPLPHSFGKGASRAVSLNQIREDGTLDYAYANYIERTLQISDELALLFPISDGSFLALCLDRLNGVFSRAEIGIAVELQKILAEMHHQHVRRAVDHQVSQFLHRYGAAATEVMIISENKTLLYRSEAWDWAAQQAFSMTPTAAQIHAAGSTDTPGREGWLLTRLDPTTGDAVLEGAEVFLLRRNASDMAERLDQFSRRHGLTPRQREIVELSVRGMPNAAIAKQMGITVGGVKNHKLRLYEKLDITSERELSSVVIAELWPNATL